MLWLGSIPEAWTVRDFGLVTSRRGRLGTTYGRYRRFWHRQPTPSRSPAGIGKTRPVPCRHDVDHVPHHLRERGVDFARRFGSVVGEDVPTPAFRRCATSLVSVAANHRMR